MFFFLHWQKSGTIGAKILNTIALHEEKLYLVISAISLYFQYAVTLI